MFQQKFKVCPYFYLLPSKRRTSMLLLVLNTSTFILGFSSKLSTASSWSDYSSIPAFVSVFCPLDQAVPLFPHVSVLGQEASLINSCQLHSACVPPHLSHLAHPLNSLLSYLILTSYDSAIKKHFTAQSIDRHLTK